MPHGAVPGQEWVCTSQGGLFGSLGRGWVPGLVTLLLRALHLRVGSSCCPSQLLSTLVLVFLGEGPHAGTMLPSQQPGRGSGAGSLLQDTV